MIKHTLVALCFVFSGPALANQINVTIDFDHELDTSTLKLEARANGDLLPENPTHTFQCQLPKAALMMPLQITTSDAPDGHANFSMRFNLPFYDVSDPIILAAPIVPRQFSGSHIRDLDALNSALFNPKADLDLIRIHQRALQALITARSFMQSIPRAANREDGRIGFQLAKATQRLMLEQYYVPDARTEDAIAFVESLLADPEPATRVFPNINERENLIAVLRSIAATPSSLRTAMVNRIDPMIFDLDAEKSADACKRAEAMSEIYRELASSDTSELQSELRNLEGVAICYARFLDWAVGGTAPPYSNERLSRAGLILAMVRNRIENYEDRVSPADDKTNNRTRASSRADELEAKIVALSQ